ncbi:hypothetical protein EVAR_61076_1 [Eumeta japonica]|uniref:Uncharacterized protein n=1 Tax=Eumeta variegata TaxID=151549 RepID=A0A4C1YQA7_EUMVA|nr:hypothetical protein EVAR_61076_1 [Eumeta japonica]
MGDLRTARAGPDRTQPRNDDAPALDSRAARRHRPRTSALNRYSTRARRQTQPIDTYQSRRYRAPTVQRVRPNAARGARPPPAARAPRAAHPGGSRVQPFTLWPARPRPVGPRPVGPRPGPRRRCSALSAMRAAPARVAAALSLAIVAFAN